MSQHNASSRSGSIHQFGATSNSNSTTNPNVEVSLAVSTERYQPGYTVSVGSHRVEIVNYLAEGGFSQVYVVKFVGYTNEFDVDSRRDRDSGSGSSKPLQLGDVACLKRVLVSDDAGLEKMRNEMEVMKKLQNAPTVVRYYDSNATRNTNGNGGYEVLLLMELCSNNSLLDYMNQRLSTKLSEQEVLKIMYDITIAIAQMHYLPTPLIHRDIKIENVLVDQNNNFKLCDFGSACQCSPIAMTNSEIAILAQDIFAHTTPQYRSPEMIDLYRYLPINEKSDIWALGVFLYKLFFYTTPFERTGQYAILHSKYEIPSNNYDPRLIMLMNSMLAENPHARPNIYQILHTLCDILGMKCPLNDKYGKGPYNFKSFGEYQTKLRNLEYQLVFFGQKTTSEWSSSDDKIFDELFTAYYTVLPKLDVLKHGVDEGCRETSDVNITNSQAERRILGVGKNVSSESVPMMGVAQSTQKQIIQQKHFADGMNMEERLASEDIPETHFPAVSEFNNMMDEEFKSASAFKPPSKYSSSVHSDSSSGNFNDARNFGPQISLVASNRQPPQPQKSQGSSYSGGGVPFFINSTGYTDNNGNNNNNNNNATTFTSPPPPQQQQQRSQPINVKRESQLEVKVKLHKSNNPFPNIQQSIALGESQQMSNSSNLFMRQQQQQQQHSNKGGTYVDGKSIPIVNPKRNSYHSGFPVGSLPASIVRGATVLNTSHNSNNGDNLNDNNNLIYSKSYTQVTSDVNQQETNQQMYYGTPDKQQTFQVTQRSLVTEGRNAGMSTNKGKLSTRDSVTRQTIQLPVGVDSRFPLTMNSPPYQQPKFPHQYQSQVQAQAQAQTPVQKQVQPQLQRNARLERQRLNETPVVPFEEPVVTSAPLPATNTNYNNRIQTQQVQDTHNFSRGEENLLFDLANSADIRAVQDGDRTKVNPILDIGNEILKRPLDLSYNEMNLSRDSSIDEASIPIGGDNNNNTYNESTMILSETDIGNTIMASHQGSGSSLSVVDVGFDREKRNSKNRMSVLRHGGNASGLGHMKKDSAASSVSILVDLEEIGQKINQMKEKNGSTDVVLRKDGDDKEGSSRSRKHGSAMDTKRKSLDLRYQEINFSDPDRMGEEDTRRRSYAAGLYTNANRAYAIGDIDRVHIDDDGDGSGNTGEGDKRNIFSRPSEIKDDLSGILKGKNRSSTSLLGGRPSFSRTRQSFDITRIQRDNKRSDVKSAVKGPKEGTSGGGRKSIFSIFKSEKK